jgi:hypothetical protein
MEVSRGRGDWPCFFSHRAMLALTRTRDPEVVQRYFDEY